MAAIVQPPFPTQNRLIDQEKQPFGRPVAKTAQHRDYGLAIHSPA